MIWCKKCEHSCGVMNAVLLLYEYFLQLLANNQYVLPNAIILLLPTRACGVDLVY